MRLIIAGSRDLSLTAYTIEELMFSMGLDHKKITEIVSGCAKGIDYCGEQVARDLGKNIIRFPAQWEKHGVSAGPLRNAEMAEYADALLLIWNGDSKGSRSMHYEMYKRRKPIFEVILKTPAK